EMLALNPEAVHSSDSGRGGGMGLWFGNQMERGMTGIDETHPTAELRASSASGRGWVGIAANAGSGSGAGRRRVEGLVEELGQKGLAARVAWDLAGRSALVAAAAHDPGCRCLVAAGGDGTVAALINERPTVPITVLPTGTENLFAGHFGLARRPD